MTIRFLYVHNYVCLLERAYALDICWSCPYISREKTRNIAPTNYLTVLLLFDYYNLQSIPKPVRIVLLCENYLNQLKNISTLFPEH